MIARGFKSVIWVATVGGAALACYMVSLQVATERSQLESVERQIVAAKQDIRSLQTELGTRGRLSQLENWNAEVLALSAPTSAQFLQNEFTLARLERREPTVGEQIGQVHMASLQAEPQKAGPSAAPAVVQAAAPQPAPAAPQPLVRRASFVPEAAPAKAATETAPSKPRVQVAAKSKADVPTEPKAAAKSAKPVEPAAAKRDEPRPARLGRLAEELGAAAHREKATGGN